MNENCGPIKPCGKSYPNTENSQGSWYPCDTLQKVHQKYTLPLHPVTEKAKSDKQF